jgi:hypothetical protein
MAISTDQLITLLNNLGFYQFVLPWLFVFAIVFGLLSVSKLFGEGNKKIPAVIALVIAFFATAYGGAAMAAFFIGIFSGATIVIAVILVILLFIFMFGFNKDIFSAGKNRPIIIMIVMVVIGIILFLAATGAAGGIGLSLVLSPDMIALILVLIVILAAVWLIVKGDNGGGGAPPKKE